MPTASTQKLRNQVEEFKKARGWTEEQFATKTANWDAADFDELANGFIRQQTLSKRDQEFQDKSAKEIAQVKSEYSTRFEEVAKLQAQAEAKMSEGTNQARAVAEKIIAKVREKSGKLVEDYGVPADQLTIDLGEYNSLFTNPAPGTQQYQPQVQQQALVNTSGLTEKQVKDLLDAQVNQYGRNMLIVQDAVNDYNFEFGKRIKVTDVSAYMAQHGVDDFKAALEEMTDAPTLRAEKAKTEEESRFQARLAVELGTAKESRLKQAAPSHMGAGNADYDKMPPIFGNFAGKVTETSGDAANGRTERSRSERLQAGMQSVLQKTG